MGTDQGAAPHLLFAFAPTMDTHDRFFTAHPGSLLHAIAPVVHDMDAGHLSGTYCDRIYHPKVLTAGALELWRAMLGRERPSHVAISSTYDSWHVAIRLSQIVRRLLPAAVIIHGGPHLDEVLEPFVLARTAALDPLSRGVQNLVDFAVAGDGEYALRWLVSTTAGAASGDEAVRMAAAASDGVRLLPGTGHIVFGKGEHRTSLKFRNPLPLDSLPFPPRHLLPVEDLFDFDCFRDGAGRRRPTASMLTHRGCRARCNFCSEGLPYQGRSHTHVLREAEQLASSGVRAVFLDDSTVQDDREFEALLTGFHRLGLEVGALTRFDQISDVATLRRMRDLGLVYLYASVEQYSDSSLELMHKKLRTQQIDDGVRNCAAAGIRLGVSLSSGCPTRHRTVSGRPGLRGPAPRS